jgi:hypothetical protein
MNKKLLFAVVRHHEAKAPVCIPLGELAVESVVVCVNE